MILNTFRRAFLNSYSTSSPRIFNESTIRSSNRITQVSQLRKMNVSAIDSRIFRSLFGTEEIRDVGLLHFPIYMLFLKKNQGGRGLQQEILDGWAYTGNATGLRRRFRNSFCISIYLA